MGTLNVAPATTLDYRQLAEKRLPRFLFDYIDGTHFYASFGHLEGYTSAYYTYMWSLVISKDLFSAFDRNRLFDTAVAYRYRDEILAAGGRSDAADLVANFLGRPYSFEAFGRWLDAEPVPVG